MNKIFKPFSLFIIGGATYLLVEVLWRCFMGSTPTHWSMFIIGGLSFLLIGGINEYFSWEMNFWLQCLIGTIVILILEFISGYFLNIVLKLDVWDYSNVPFNLMGQVCIPFAFAWYGLSAVAIVIDDYLRYWLFKEEKPHYQLQIKR